mmetsp:Transcript_38203/g.88320  ORF Transcript_38203/g.88320 Transcript_38203/m.88320 type:complete len:277 (+) Transcript_38203:243-1073(+)
MPLDLPILEGLLPISHRGSALNHFLHLLNNAALHCESNLLLHAGVQAGRNHAICSTTTRWRTARCLLRLLLLLLLLLVPGKVLGIELIPLLPLRPRCLFCSLHLAEGVLVLLPLHPRSLLRGVGSIEAIPRPARRRRLRGHLWRRIPGRFSGGLVVVVDVAFRRLTGHPRPCPCGAALRHLLLRLLRRLHVCLGYHLATRRNIPSGFTCLPIAEVCLAVFCRHSVPVSDREGLRLLDWFLDLVKIWLADLCCARRCGLRRSFSGFLALFPDSAPRW